jgi:hypothetical protein
MIVDGAIKLLHKLRTIVLVETNKAAKTQTFQYATKERSLIRMKMYPIGVKGLGSSNGRPFGHRDIDILHNLLLNFGPKPRVFMILTRAEMVRIQPPQSTPLANVHLANIFLRNTVNLPTITTNLNFLFCSTLSFNLSPIKLNTIRTVIIFIFVTRGTRSLTHSAWTAATNTASSPSQGSTNLHMATGTSFRRKGLLRVPRRHNSGLMENPKPIKHKKINVHAKEKESK